MLTFELPIRVFNMVKRTQGALNKSNASFVLVAQNNVSDERVHFLPGGTELYFEDSQAIIGEPVILISGGNIPDWSIKLRIGTMVYKLENLQKVQNED